MSADNGIYILETGISEREYRVAHLQAVENIYYNEDAPKGKHCANANTISTEHDFRTCPKCIAWEEKFNSKNPSVHIKNARKMWAGCVVFKTEAEALKEAAYQLKQLTVCEYGISFIRIARDF